MWRGFKRSWRHLVVTVVRKPLRPSTARFAPHAACHGALCKKHEDSCSAHLSLTGANGRDPVGADWVPFVHSSGQLSWKSWIGQRCRASSRALSTRGRRPLQSLPQRLARTQNRMDKHKDRALLAPRGRRVEPWQLRLGEAALSLSKNL